MKDSRHHLHCLQKKVLQDTKRELASQIEKKRKEEEKEYVEASRNAKKREGESMPIPDYVVEAHIPRSVRLKRQWNINPRWH